MGYPVVTQTWTISYNNRYTFATVIGAMGSFIVSLKNFLKTTMGYTVKGSCDGTTGAMDGVDRLTSASNWATRFNGAAGAQSWLVLTDGAGIDWCWSYNSASDDIVRLAHSQGGKYVAAATANQQPTAVDECFDAASGTWVNSTASADRVWTMWGSLDKKMWRAGIYRSGAMVSFTAGEKFISTLISPATFTLANGGGTVAAIKSYYNENTSSFNRQYSASLFGDLCRVHTNQDVNCQATFGGEMPGTGVGRAGSGGAVQNWFSASPALQGGTGEPMFPTTLASTTSAADGVLGVKYDHWYTFSGDGVLDTLGSLSFVCAQPGAGIILPGDGVTTPVSS